MSEGSKFLFVALLISLTFFYSHYEKRKVDILTADTGFVLKSLPAFDGTLLGENKATTSTDFVSSFPGTYVHFWGTWCAPCEAEFPDLLKFASKVKDKKIGFLLVAINDKEEKVQKFLKRFELPENVSIIVKEDVELMARFGTFKVPETYLFNQTGDLVTKYVGSQGWSNPSYLRQIDRLIFGSDEKLKVIETH